MCIHRLVHDGIGWKGTTWADRRFLAMALGSTMSAALEGIWSLRTMYKEDSFYRKSWGLDLNASHIIWAAICILLADNRVKAPSLPTTQINAQFFRYKIIPVEERSPAIIPCPTVVLWIDMAVIGS